MTALLTPAYKLTIGHHVTDSTAEPKTSATTDLIVSLDMDRPLDGATLELGQVGGLDPQQDDDVKIELGYTENGGFTTVFTGFVDSLEPTLLSRRVICFSPMRALARLFVDETYESQTAGAMVSDLASKASVDTVTIDDGIDYPVYVADERRSAFTHCRDLAIDSGCDLFTDSDGKLHFHAFDVAATVHDFEFAKQVIKLDVLRTPQRDATIAVWGESAADSDGADAAFWLSSDFSKSTGTAGSGSPSLLIERPSLRTGQAAKTAASAALRRIEQSVLRGRVLVFGDPDVKLTDAVRFSGLADDTFNAMFQVRSVTHRLTKRGGFTTEIGFAAIATETLP